MLQKGEIPIEKNVVVTDEFGRKIGFTYPKRVKGLIKNGRAEYVDDCTIRLTHASTVLDKNTEDLIMSNVIDLNAREFRFDSDIENQAGTRRFITDSSGNNREIFEIGDWNWSWSQIRCTKQLEPDTDYVFRFAMTGGFNDTQDAVSRFIIFYDDRWEDRYVYSLAKSEYKPQISKRNGDNLLRVYEIPFHTESNRDTTFMFVAQHAQACFMTAQKPEYYADMDDLSYSEWWENRHGYQEHKQAGSKNIDLNSIISDAVKHNAKSIDLTGACISRSTLEKLLEKMDGHGSIDLTGACISEE